MAYAGENQKMKLQSGLIDTYGANLYFETTDGDGFPLILLHGFALDRRMWDDQMEALAGQSRLIRYDLRGFGKSSMAATSPYRHTGDLEDLMDTLELERADLMGLSLGGAVALDFALAYPDRVRSLILLDPVLNGFDWSEEGQARDRSIFERAREGGIPAGKRAWLLHPLFEPLMTHTEAAMKFEQILNDYSGWHFINSNPLIHEDPPAAARLSEITVPALILVGEDDMPDFRRIADTLEAQMPAAKKVVVPNVGHLPNMEAPDEINKVVLRFLVSLI